MSGPQLAGLTVIVTTDPEPFMSRFAAELGTTVRVFDNSNAALEALNTPPCDRLFADFRQLIDGWSGLRLLRRIRGDSTLDHVQVFLMASEWQAAQEVSAMQAGAAGLVKRSPNVIAGHMALPVSRSARPDPWKPMTKADSASTQPADRPAPALSTLVTVAWADAVHAIFKDYAGALGARLMIAATTAALHGSKMSRLEYANDLTARLTTPERRGEFAAALRAAGLIQTTRNR